LDPSFLNCKIRYCKLVYFLIIFSLIILCGIIICFFNRKRIFQSGNKICRLLGKSSSNKMTKYSIGNDIKINSEDKPLVESNKEINLNRLIIENEVFKRGRFSSIYRAKFEDENVIIKVLSKSDQAQPLFHNEKEIYLSPFMSHINILK
jgi:hypothetical protein